MIKQMAAVGLAVASFGAGACTNPEAAPKQVLEQVTLSSEPPETFVATITTISQANLEEIARQKAAGEAEARENGIYVQTILLPALGRIGVRQLEPTDVDPNNPDTTVNIPSQFIVSFNKKCALQMNMNNIDEHDGGPSTEKIDARIERAA